MWQRSDTIEGNGYFWTNEAEGIAAFEDTSEGASRFYAWLGDADDHDNEGHGNVSDTLDGAADSLYAIIEGREQP